MADAEAEAEQICRLIRRTDVTDDKAFFGFWTEFHQIVSALRDTDERLAGAAALRGTAEPDRKLPIYK